ncbi:MAG: glycoside hydrolase family 130 protein [Planctomycetia bacterium]|nr:glycoside hydrolase family 130 protein [Planctomycetia bacterium]
MDVKRTGIVLKPNNSRVLFRRSEPANQERILKIIARVMSVSDPEVSLLLADVMREFQGRHQRLQNFFLERFEGVKRHLLTDETLSEERRLLIGAYFTSEYSLESAALFNPSMVWHPNQTGLPEGTRRFILSLRATGEGHISSITFRTGVVDENNGISLDNPTRFVTTPQIVPNPQYDKPLFLRKLIELGLANGFTEQVFVLLDDQFNILQLEDAVRKVLRQFRTKQAEWEPISKGIMALAQSNYESFYEPEQSLSERCIFPYSPAETNGIEDARFVEFHDDDASVRYYATYTAFDGKIVLPQLLETDDFLHFKISTLNGPEVRNKGFALFPRKIDGHFAMLSRQDNENIFVMYSDNLHFWYSKELILKPTFPWEFVQIGNCGSPIETEAGWLVLSHGVGPMRKYSMGAFLLDLDNPTKVIGRLSEPLLTPNENEREGYVPNVVYSCGAALHGRELIIPYAMADYASTFATVALDEVLASIRPC